MELPTSRSLYLLQQLARVNLAKGTGENRAWLGAGLGKTFLPVYSALPVPDTGYREGWGGGAEQWVWGWALGDDCVPHVGGQRVAHRDGKVLLHPEAEWVS